MILMVTPLPMTTHIYCWFDHHFVDVDANSLSLSTYGNLNTQKFTDLPFHFCWLNVGFSTIRSQTPPPRCRHVARWRALPRSATAPWEFFLGHG
jgi:hypothetical protein